MASFNILPGIDCRVFLHFILKLPSTSTRDEHPIINHCFNKFRICILYTDCFLSFDTFTLSFSARVPPSPEDLNVNCLVLTVLVFKFSCLQVHVVAYNSQQTSVSMTYLLGYACEESIDFFQIFFQNEFVIAKVAKIYSLSNTVVVCVFSWMVKLWKWSEPAAWTALMSQNLESWVLW